MENGEKWCGADLTVPPQATAAVPGGPRQELPPVLRDEDGPRPPGPPQCRRQVNMAVLCHLTLN